MEAPELSGHYLNDKEAIAKLFTDNYVSILPSENSLNFFVQCSEERLYRVRNGIRLKEAVENHLNIFGSLVKQRKPAHSNEEEHKKLKQAVILGLDHQHPRPVTGNSYFPLETVKESVGQTSAGMKEYIRARKFDPEIERKKHHFLPSYFYERYARISTLLNERQKYEAFEAASPASFAGPQGARKKDAKGTIKAEPEDPFIAKIDEIDESIRREVDDKATSKKREEQLRMQKESYIASLIHNKKPKKVGTDFIDHRYLKLRALGQTMYSRPLAEVKPKIVEFLEKAVFPDTPPDSPGLPRLSTHSKSTPFLSPIKPPQGKSLESSPRPAVTTQRQHRTDPVRESEEMLLSLNSAFRSSGRKALPLTPSGKIREIVTRALSIERAL